jgi:hypothetical protein
LNKPIQAVFNKRLLKKIEKPEEASTCVFDNQKLNGHIGSLIPKPSINKKVKASFWYFKNSKFFKKKK